MAHPEDGYSSRLVDPATEAARMVPAKLIPRRFWGATSPRQVKMLTLPVSNVVGTYTEMDPCSTTEECIQRMQELQKKHMDQHLSDIQYNYVVCGDGNIYEGRGWSHQGPTYSPLFKHGTTLTGKSIEVAIMGHFSGPPTSRLMETATDCIAMGMVGEHLTDKIDFYWKTPYGIEFVDTYDLNGPLSISSNSARSLEPGAG